MYFILSFAVNISQNLFMNNLFLSVMNSFDSSWLLINFHNIICVNTDVVAVFLKSINMIYFVNWLIIIKILLNVTFHTEFFNNNSFTMKFIVTDIHKAFNAFSCVTSLYCLLQSILFHWQKSHFAIYCQTLLQQFWRLHFCQTRSSVLLIFKCSLILVLWHFLMTSSSSCETSFMWWMMTRFLVRISSLFSLRILL